ncbi:LON peptidase substrate-binding domain-containing protein [Thaumasiovibrio sp. DFM-14]|uniref:LON peptidase substrate-binding domain-containing protein n=1 Tax=Thaumasiovibrio sp. DFM-14 TaxID=3384792 RepID=UPI0039A3BC34
MSHYLFPLPIILLPGGITNLRIFEPRYLRLIKECAANHTGFVLAMTENAQISPLGTLVRVIDYQQRDDHLLGVTIKASHIVKASNTHQQQDGLWVADTERQPYWLEQEERTIGQSAPLTTSLQTLFNDNPALAGLYANPAFTDPAWVCCRWLELIPLSAAQMQWCLAQHDHTEVQRYLLSMLFDSTPPH